MVVGHEQKGGLQLFLVSRRESLAFLYAGSARGLRLPLFQMRSVASFVQNAFAYRVVKFFLSSCCSLIIELLLFVCRVVAHCLSSCKLFKVLLFLSELSCLVCCVGSLPNLATHECSVSIQSHFCKKWCDPMLRIQIQHFLNKKPFSFHHSFFFTIFYNRVQVSKKIKLPKLYNVLQLHVKRKIKHEHLHECYQARDREALFTLFG